MVEKLEIKIGMNEKEIITQCSNCKSLRRLDKTWVSFIDNPKDWYMAVSEYGNKYNESVGISHGICLDCAKRDYLDLDFSDWD